MPNAGRGVLRPRDGTRPDHTRCRHSDQKPAVLRPLHAAVNGVPGSGKLENPTRQRAVTLCLIEAGAGPNAAAAGGVTPLHRAPRNRSWAAVEACACRGLERSSVALPSRSQRWATCE